MTIKLSYPGETMKVYRGTVVHRDGRIASPHICHYATREKVLRDARNVRRLGFRLKLLVITVQF